MTDRQYWVQTLVQIANPVFAALAKGSLRDSLPLTAEGKDDRAVYAPLEAVGRTLAGIGPWLNCPTEGPEELQRRNLCNLVIAGLGEGANPDSPDFLNFSEGHQPIVDAAFLAQGLLRCWDQVWLKLDDRVRQQVVDCMASLRNRRPGFCNWLLFSATVEAFLYKAGAHWDPMRVDYALRQHEQWYKGDGAYGDGQHFHWDYYNSFVIQPMLYDILHVGGQISKEWAWLLPLVSARLTRYAAIQERFIAPDGSFPPIGRSLTYRFGAFQALALAALENILPDDLDPAAVRCALSAVIHRMMDRSDVYDANGWLRPGFCGYQPSLAEGYISTGSLYLCACGLLPLGLAPVHPFWSDPATDWTSRRIWNGEDHPADHALMDHPDVGKVY